MNQDGFDACMAVILSEEGGLVDHPDDPGGLTKYGISHRAYPREDIENLTPERAMELYHRDYWRPISADRIPVGLDLIVFDAAINQGQKPAVAMLQRAAGIDSDGLMGEKTLTRINRAGDAEAIAVRMCALRACRYAGNPKFPIFGQGWMVRLFRVFRAAQRMGRW